MTQIGQRKVINESPVTVDKIETEHLREELEAERDKYLRLAAEYKNYRRRTEQENADAQNYYGSLYGTPFSIKCCHTIKTNTQAVDRRPRVCRVRRHI